MTTTSTYQGLAEKPSSRVLAAPGGGSSNIFGHYQEEAPSQNRGARANKETDNVGGGAAAHTAPRPAGASDILNQGPAASMPERGRPQRSAFNPITGEPYDTAPKVEQPKAEVNSEKTEEETEQAPQTTDNQAAASAASSGPERVQPSTRVIQPPGGRSTKLW